MADANANKREKIVSDILQVAVPVPHFQSKAGLLYTPVLSPHFSLLLQRCLSFLTKGLLILQTLLQVCDLLVRGIQADFQHLILTPELMHFHPGPVLLEPINLRKGILQCTTCISFSGTCGPQNDFCSPKPSCQEQSGLCTSLAWLLS